jgi:hypothetical protein
LEGAISLKIFKGIFLFISVFTLAFLASGSIKVSAASPEMRVHAIYLNNSLKGESVLLESQGSYLLMDIGEASHANKAIIPYLRSLGVTDLEIYFSHLHPDHLGSQSGLNANTLKGLQDIEAAGFNITKLYLPNPAISPLSPTYGSKYKKLEKYFKDRVELQYLNVGDTITVGDAVGRVIGPVNTHLLHPSTYSFDDIMDAIDDVEKTKYTFYENDCSLVTMFQCGSKRYLATGDILTQQSALLAQAYGSGLRADIMKLPHHGTKIGNSTALMNAVKPNYSFALNTQYAGKQTTGNWVFHHSLENARRYGMCY